MILRCCEKAKSRVRDQSESGAGSKSEATGVEGVLAGSKVGGKNIREVVF